MLLTTQVEVFIKTVGARRAKFVAELWQLVGERELKELPDEIIFTYGKKREVYKRQPQFKG